MGTKEEDIIKRLLEGSLKPQEREKINEKSFVNGTLYQQWEKTEGKTVDSIKEARILKGIMQKVNKKENYIGNYSIYRYGIAAIIALCMVISTLLYIKNPRQEIIYVMNTGYQSIDSVKLADGTMVVLNAGSRLTYPKEFSGKGREVALSGQAFFKVKSDKEHPFIVKTAKMDVTVLGTSFEVFSYDNDKSAETILLTGKVRIEMPGDKGQTRSTYILHPDEKLTYTKNGEVVLTKVDADSYSSWRDGKRMNFKHETLEMILPRLEKWYGQKITCDTEIARHYLFTFAIHNESLDLILNYISHSAPLKYRLVSNDHYVIEEKK
ncbi:FecR family protein [Phocaeicola sp.]